MCTLDERKISQEMIIEVAYSIPWYDMIHKHIFSHCLLKQLHMKYAANTWLNQFKVHCVIQHCLSGISVDALFKSWRISVWKYVHRSLLGKISRLHHIFAILSKIFWGKTIPSCIGLDAWPPRWSGHQGTFGWLRMRNIHQKSDTKCIDSHHT